MGVEHPAFSNLILGQDAIASTDKPTLAQRRVFLSEQGKLARGVYDNRRFSLSVPQGVADLFAYRLGLKCGVRTARVFLTREEPTDFANYYVRKVPGGWAVSARVSNAIPLYYLKSHAADILSPMSPWEGFLHRKFLWALDKRCPVGRAAYADFPEPPSDEVKEAVRWNSREMLLGHAFRSLLYASYGHVSNILVDVEGNLWLIDFEKMVFRKDFGDIEVLYVIAAESESVMEVCRQLCTLTADDIKESLTDIPDDFWCGGATFSDEESAAAYFIDRLGAWKQHFEEGRVMHACE
jgi:hypothetical protein